MDYLESISYIKNIERSGSKYGLERMRDLLDLLDSVDDKLKFIHIAGTNGKGSTTAYLTSILKEEGYKVGTYNSPSVFNYNERWLIDGEMLKDEDVAKYMTIVKDTIEKERNRRELLNLGEFNPTAFEIETALALIAFYDKGCNICILETGLGGRWDATNAIHKKEIAVITRIGLDHCYLLGNTLEEIAGEKAAIIQDDVVTVNQDEDVINVIKNPIILIDGKAQQISSNLHIAKEATLLSSSLVGQKFEYEGNDYEIKLLGEHQIENASLVIETIKVLNKKGIIVSNNALQSGLKNATWKARFEIVENAQTRFNIDVPTDKTLVFDGSHNPQGAATIVNSIEKYFKNKRIHMVVGILKDKDVKGVIDEFVKVANKITCVTPPSPRAMENNDLIKIINGRVESSLCDDIKQAIQEELYDKDSDVVVLCGSLTLFEIL